MKNKNSRIVIVTIIFFAIILILNTNKFYHGFYFKRGGQENIQNYLELSSDGYEFTFVNNSENKVAGFSFIFANIDEKAEGKIKIVISKNDKIVDTIEDNLNNIKNNTYYNFYTNKKMLYGEYKVHIFCEDCLNNSKILAANNITNSDVFYKVAYSYPLLNFIEIITLSLVIIAIYLVILSRLIENNKLKKGLVFGSISIILVMLLTWNYSTNSFNINNDSYKYFQSDSEQLVINAIGSDNNVFGFNNYGLVFNGYNHEYYKSQYGLQGKVFSGIEKESNYGVSIAQLNFACSLLTAITLTTISYLISKKFNKLMGVIFYLTFLLSPWIVNFARNLYWVEFTWFVPMLVGLICSLYLRNKKVIKLCYFATFTSILIKCLCGYEYITTIMLSLIAFLVFDLIKSIIAKDKSSMALIFKTTILIGIFALLGFIVAIIMHANIKGEGNLIEGIKLIFEEDMLRRTAGANYNNFDSGFWDSFNASWYDVIKMYFHFNTDIIANIPNTFFPIIIIVPLVMFILNYINKKLDYTDLILYILFFITSISWFILGKSHSYVHTHMNYVLWYFGYIQICFYIIIKQFKNYIEEK